MEIVTLAKKKFIRIAALSGVVSLCCLITAVMVNFSLSDTEQQLMMMNAQRAGIQAGHAQAVERYRLGEENKKIMAELNPTNDPLFGTLDRQKATSVLEQLNQKYQLSGLNLNISPAAVKADPPFQRKTGGTNISNVSIMFSSITDEYAYAFLRDIIASFPGFMHLTTLNLTKKDAIGEDILYAVHNGEIPPKVDGVITFDWLGLEIKEENAATTPQP